MAPYNDSVMYYDYEEHKYYLAPEGVTDAIGVNLDLALNASAARNPQAVRNFLDRVTESVYEYIYEDSSSAEYLEYLLANHKPLRKFVKRMLLAQVRYALANNFIDDFSGVNIVKGTAMNPRDLRSAMRVAPEVQNLCRQDIAGLGFCLKTTLMLPPLPEWAYHVGY